MANSPSVITCALLLCALSGGALGFIDFLIDFATDVGHFAASPFVPDWQEALGKTMQCHLKSNNDFVALEYNEYGCWCGSGKQDAVRGENNQFAVDGIDHACRRHDLCYDSYGIEKGAKCDPALLPVTTFGHDAYKTKCTKGETHAFTTGFPEGSHEAQCLKWQYECDRQLAVEVARFPIPSSQSICPHCVLQLNDSFHRMYATGKHTIEDRCYVCTDNHEVSDPVPC